MPAADGQTTARSRRAGRRATRRRTPPSRPVSRPPAPTPTQIASALAQRRAYVSQGKAVEKVANNQRAAQALRRAQAHSKPLAATPMRHPRAGRPVRTVPVPGRKGYVRPARTDVNQIIAAVGRRRDGLRAGHRGHDGLRRGEHNLGRFLRGCRRGLLGRGWSARRRLR